MGIAGFLDIFQSKMSELMEFLEYVQAYLDDLLCISRYSLEDHLEKWDEVLRWLCDADLKINTKNLTFCVLEIEYLGYNSGDMVSDLRVIRCRQYLQFNCPKQWNNWDISLAWCNITVTSGQNVAICAPLSHHWLNGWRVRSDQNNNSKRNQNGTLALGRGPSKSFWSHKGYYCKRSSLGLFRLFRSIWDLHRCFQQITGGSNYSG